MKLIGYVYCSELHPDITDFRLHVSNNTGEALNVCMAEMPNHLEVHDEFWDNSLYVSSFIVQVDGYIHQNFHEHDGFLETNFYAKSVKVLTPIKKEEAV